MRFHTIGDSHAKFGWNTIANITIHNIGPKLCYSVGRDGISLPEFGVSNGDTVVFCFGEIDCRCHIHKHCSDDYKPCIDGIVKKYAKAIRTAVSVYSSLKVCIYNVVPPVRKDTIMEKEYFPLLGTDEERKQYVLYFNTKLKDACAEYGFLFFDVYDKYADEDGYLHPELSDGDVHIKNGVHIYEFLLKNHM